MSINRRKNAVKTVGLFVVYGVCITVTMALMYFLGTILVSVHESRFMSGYLSLPEVRSSLLSVTLRLVLTFTILGGLVGAVAGSLIAVHNNKASHDLL